MSFPVRGAAVFLIRSILKELLAVVGADAKARAANRRNEERVKIQSRPHIRAENRGSESSVHPPENDLCIMQECAHSLRDFVGKQP
jgi:hypothetical protein